MNTMTLIRLRQAEAKWTKAKTSGTERAQQKAKAELTVVRDEWRAHVRPRLGVGDAAAAPSTLKAQATNPTKGDN